MVGHNGAGKTTTISVLTGMIRQDGGDATVDGLSVEHDMKLIRRSLGVCPQFDVLWPSVRRCRLIR
jgi:ABC-type multidrug transport system ATPase subunit